ncbi:hypothetical protein [Pectobacterium aroidearum]|uniref:hypothetical protein n=1 Tax=Pectobacterium aroidearum TaxID=1201031 RepID=UPI0032ECACCB
MKIKSLGFSICNNNKHITNDDLVNDLISSSNHVLNRTEYSRQILVSDDGDFYTGLVLTYRNQKKNCKSTIVNGKFTVKVEDLKGDEKIVNFNFFCIKKKTMKGLYLYHHGSCSMNTLFSHLQTKSNEYIRGVADKEIKNLGKKPSQADIKKINKKYSDRVEFSIISNKKSIETVLSSFKKIKTASFRFSHLDFSEGSMRALTPYTKNTDVIFNIDTADRQKTSPIARRLNSVFSELDNLLKARVVATDYEDNDRVIDFFNCPTFFDEYDFDTLAEFVDGLTNDNYTSNQIVAIIKEQITTGKNKNVFN